MSENGDGDCSSKILVAGLGPLRRIVPSPACMTVAKCRTDKNFSHMHTATNEQLGHLSRRGVSWYGNKHTRRYVACLPSPMIIPRVGIRAQGCRIWHDFWYAALPRISWKLQRAINVALPLMQAHRLIATPQLRIGPCCAAFKIGWYDRIAIIDILQLAHDYTNPRGRTRRR